MSKRLGVLSILLGAALILSALFLYGYNRRVDEKSGDYAETVMEELLEDVDSGTAGDNENADEAEVLDPELPVVMIDGYEYVGYLQIPDLGVELPVMTDWDYAKMRIAPCRQFGSSRTDDLVIAAHNYDSFFGRIKDLAVGATIIFTDMEGIVNTYELDHLETLVPTEVDAVQYSGYDLVLYTCTYGGQTRVTAFCNRVES